MPSELKLINPNVRVRYITNAKNELSVQLQYADGTTSNGPYPKVMLDAEVDRGNGSSEKMDIICYPSSIIRRYPINKNRTEFAYQILASDYTLDANGKRKRSYSDVPHKAGKDEVDSICHQAYRFHDKIDCFYFPEIALRLFKLLQTTDTAFDGTGRNVLKWTDINTINELSALFTQQVENKADDNELESTLAQINKVLTDILAAYEYDDATQNEIKLDLPTAKTELVANVQAIAAISKLNNTRLYQLLRKAGITLTVENVIGINRFFYRELTNFPTLSVASIQQCLQENGAGALIVTNDTINEIMTGWAQLQRLQKIRNPLLRDAITEHCHRLRRTDKGLLDFKNIDEITKEYNDLRGTDDGHMSTDYLLETLPLLVQETTHPETLPMLTDTGDKEKDYIELNAINDYQQDLRTIDRVIKPVNADLATQIEIILRRNACLIDSQYRYRINDPAIINETIRAIQHDISRGANMFEALNDVRLQNILCFDIPVLSNREEKDKAEQLTFDEEVAHLNRCYGRDLQEIQNSFIDKQVNNDKAYMHLQDMHGRRLSLRVDSPENPDDPSKLVILEDTPECRHPDDADLVELLTPLTTDSVQDKRAYGPEKINFSKEAFWDEKDNQWCQYSWDRRNQCLVRIAQDNSKDAFQYKNGHWQRKNIGDLNSITIPVQQVAFPVRPPLAQRGFGRPNEEQRFTDRKGLDSCLNYYQERYNKNKAFYANSSLTNALEQLHHGLPAANAEYVTKQQREQLENALAILPEVEQVITRARSNLIKNQETLAATLNTSIDTTELLATAHDQRLQISNLYHRQYENSINAYTLQLATCTSKRKAIEKTLATASLGVKVKETAATSPDGVDVDFGEALQDNTQFINNELTFDDEPKTVDMEISSTCHVKITKTQQQTHAAFPGDAEEEDYVEGFQRSVEFSHGQLPINIRYDAKSKTAAAAAETLRDQALLYLQENDLDADVYLLINDKPYAESKLKKESHEYLKDVRNQWLTCGRQSIRKRACLNDAVNGLEDYVKQRRPQFQETSTNTPAPAA